jgi:hypothetical protein
MAVVNVQSEQAVAIVSPRYRVITNEEAVQSMLTAFDEAKLDLTDASVRVQNSYNGAQSMLRVMLPAYTVMTGKNETSLEIITLNSYNGAWRYSNYVGGFRFACANGQILGTHIGRYSQVHNAALNAKQAATHIARMIEDFDNSEEWFNSMIARKVTELEVKMFISKLARIPYQMFDESRVAKALFAQYETYATAMGANGYALYNACTDFITHKRRKEGAYASSLFEDESRFQHLLSTEYGKVIA